MGQNKCHSSLERGRKGSRKFLLKLTGLSITVPKPYDPRHSWHQRSTHRSRDWSLSVDLGTERGKMMRYLRMRETP